MAPTPERTGDDEVLPSFDEVLSASPIPAPPAAPAAPAANEAEEVADIPPAPAPTEIPALGPATQAPVENPLVAEAVAAPIVDDKGVPIAFISDGDVTRFLAQKNATYTDPVLLIMLSGASDTGDFGRQIDHLMDLNVLSIATRRVIDVDIHTSLPTVCRILGENHLKKIPVTENGQLVGVINRSDIAHYSMARYLASRESAQ